MQNINNIKFRYRLAKNEAKNIRSITKSTGFFTKDEVSIAEELALAHIAQGEKTSGYFFVTAWICENLVAYSCYGPIPGSDTGYDLYWIVTDAKYRGKGFGKRLLQETEQMIAKSGGQNLYAETSSTPLYAPTRSFYEHNDYLKEAVLKDFYRPGDDKVFYSKKLPRN